MSETTNYGLYVTDDSSERFLNWREKMNGVTNSNMTKIDQVLSEKAERSTKLYLTLVASAWVGIDSPFTQELFDAAITEDMNGNIAPAHSATADQRLAARQAELGVIGQADGSITIVADGEMPEVDIPVCIIINY